MSWTDFYRRQEILEATIRQAGRNPGAPLPLDEIPGAEDHFGGEESLLLALHYKWTQLLSGQLRAELTDPDDTASFGGSGVAKPPGGGAGAAPRDGTASGDQVDAVTRAWRRTTGEHPELRALLDAGVERHPSLGQLREGELRMLAVTAGLAEPREPAAEITKVGHALDALLRAGDGVSLRRRNPIGQLRRLLAHSA